MPHDAIAGEAVAEHAHDRHGAADRRLETQLAPLPLGQRQQRVALMRDDLFARGDDRLAGQQRRANVVGGRLAARMASTMMSTSLARRSSKRSVQVRLASGSDWRARLSRARRSADVSELEAGGWDRGR